MDDFKKETVVGYTELDLNTKCVQNKNRHKDTQIVKRSARRKRKQNLRNVLDKNLNE